MDFIVGKKYIYSNTERVGIHCKRRKIKHEVIYLGERRNEYVFKMSTGTRLLVFKCDVDECIREAKGKHER
jgi:hypothetical protein